MFNHNYGSANMSGDITVLTFRLTDPALFAESE